MRLRKWLIFFVAATLIVSAMALGAVAETADPAETFEVGVAATTAAPVSTSPVIFNQGDKVTVTVSINENPGITGVDFVVEYDEDALVYVDSKLAKEEGTGELLVHYEEKSYVRYFLLTPDAVCEYEGTLFSITFTAKEDFCGKTAIKTHLLNYKDENCAYMSPTYPNPAEHWLVPFTANDVNFQIHNIDVNDSVFTKGSCMVDEKWTHHCKSCEQELITDFVEHPGHTVVYDEVVKQPTCTEPGEGTGAHCSVCGEILEGHEEIPATGHTEVVDAAVAATCTTAGKTEGKHCSVCNEVLVAQEEVPATGHTEVVDAAVAATCTTAGKTEGKHCSVCNEVLVAQEEVPATGHTEVVDAAVAATCTTAGKTEGKHCSVCNEVLVAQEEVPATGHGETEIRDRVEAQVGVDGYTGDTYCKACGEKLQSGEKIDMLEEKGCGCGTGCGTGCGSGCGSILSAGVVMVAVLGSALLLKKKED